MGARRGGHGTIQSIISQTNNGCSLLSLISAKLLLLDIHSENVFALSTVTARGVATGGVGGYNQWCKVTKYFYLRRKNKAAVNLKTGRFDNINSAVIISSVCKAVQNCKMNLLQFCTALHTLLMMTAEFMLSKRPVLRFTAALFFLLKLFSSHF